MVLASFLSYAGFLDQPMSQHQVSQNVVNWWMKFGLPVKLPLFLLVFLALTLVQGLMQMRISIINTQINRPFVIFLNNRLFKTFAEANWEFIINQRKSDIISLITSENWRIDAGCTSLTQIITIIPAIVIQIIIALYLSVKITLLALLGGLALAVFMYPYLRRSRLLGLDLLEINKKLTAEIHEQLHGIREIKSYGLEQQSSALFYQINYNLYKNMLNFTRVKSVSDFFNGTCSAALIGGFLFFATTYIKASGLDLMAILIIFSRLMPKFTTLQGSLQYFFMMLPVYANYLQFIQQGTENKEQLAGNANKQKQPLSPTPLILQQEITINNLSFAYSCGAPVLKNISLRLPAGKTTAIIGQSGSGKSTLANLLLGLLKTDNADNILIDGVKLDENCLLSWRQMTGYVPQEPFLFNGTVWDNLLLVKADADNNQLRAALEAASAEFVYTLPQGLETFIGDRGIKLSGGERQRIALARALIRKPQVLILDEATSALDAENEQNIVQTIDNLNGKITIIIIAHRLSTIKNADYVYVLSHGNIVNQGTFADLCRSENLLQLQLQ